MLLFWMSTSVVKFRANRLIEMEELIEDAVHWNYSGNALLLLQTISNALSLKAFCIMGGRGGVQVQFEL